MDCANGEYHRRDLPTGLYAILDRQISGLDHVTAAARVLAGGARVIQLRDKQATFEELVDAGRQVLALTRRAGALLIINDNPYLAVEIDADGVHVGQEDIPADIAREIVGPDRIVGLSTHNRKQARAAESLPVDYIGIGPIFRTRTKKSDNPVMSTEFVRWVAKSIRLPHVAIGGITLDRIPEIRQAGGTRAAVISDIMGSGDITARTRQFVEAFEVPLNEES
jgi:thiamine-phosphate pyrophosphorylase